MNKQVRKVSDEKKFKRMELRVTESDFSTINTLCAQAGITRSSYILQSVLDKKVLTNIDAQVIFQLRKIGNNLNQITKQVHIISKFVDKKEETLPSILQELSSMNGQIEAISNYIFKDHAGKN